MTQLSYDEKMDLIASALQEEINLLDTLPPDKAKEMAHSELVNIGMINESGALTPPYAERRSRYAI